MYKLMHRVRAYTFDFLLPLTQQINCSVDLSV